MRFDRVRPIDWVAGATGVALLVVLALPWYDLLDGSLTGFQALSVVDLWLALTALLAIAIPLVTAARDAPPVPLGVTVTAVACSWIAFLLALWRAIDSPRDGVDPTAMPWIAVLVVLALGVASWRAMRDERAPGLRPAPAARTMPAPPANAPAEPTAEAT
jgi:drug/metabolite transporter (DMT)-like permease